MNESVTTPSTLKSQTFSEKAFRLLVLVIWTQHTILSFVIQIVRRLPIIGSFYTLVIPALIIILAFFALPTVLKSTRASDLAFYAICAAVAIGSLAFNAATSNYIEKELANILLATLPLYFVGLAYSHEVSKNDLFWASLFGAAAMFLYQFYSLSLGRELEMDNMDTAYKVLPSVMYLIYWAFVHKKIRFWLPAVLAMLLMFLFGTRGPIIAEIAFLFVGLFLTIINRKSSFTKLVWLIIFAVAIALICSGDFLVNAAQFLSKRFEDIGFSTRVFDSFIEGEISESQSRNILYETVQNAILEKPLLGYGLMGDRPIVGFYVHNLFLEVWCHFGIVFGTAVLLGMIGIPSLALLKSRKTEVFYFILMLMCAVFVKLTVTGSYTAETNLFLLLGLSVNILRKQKSNSTF